LERARSGTPLKLLASSDAGRRCGKNLTDARYCDETVGGGPRAEELNLLSNPGYRAKSVNYEARPKTVGSALSTETAG
jgi:hypothetical protein